MIYLGLALLAGSAWAFILLVPLFFTMHWGVVRREEAFLTRKLGDDYRSYCRRVRRYL